MQLTQATHNPQRSLLSPQVNGRVGPAMKRQVMLLTSYANKRGAVLAPSVARGEPVNSDV